MRASVKDSALVRTDDTGWRVGGNVGHFMGFETADVFLDQIRMRHRSEEVREVIPGDDGGVMTSDRGKSYDAKEFVRVEQ